jgi:mediator of RNA polymerase II transcription subunit 31
MITFLTDASPDKARERLTLELEFVQLLANPEYVSFLARDGTLERPKVLRYLRYLLDTYSQPSYARLLLWPACLRTLARLVHNDAFRRDLLRPEVGAALKAEAEERWMRGEH